MQELQDQVSEETLPGNELDEVTSLLSGKPEKEEPGTDNHESDETADPEKETEVEDEEDSSIDYSMKIPMPGGADPVTLGELKDMYQQRQEKDLAMTERENKLLAEYDKVKDIGSALDSIDPDTRERLQQHAQREFAQEQQKLATILPEISTKEGLDSVKADLYSIGSEYGVSSSQIDQIKDAVTIKMMYDYARLKKSIKAAKDNVKPLKAANVKSSGKRNINETQNAIARAKNTGSHVDETKAIESLISGVK